MKELTIDDNQPLIVDGKSRIPNDIEKIIFGISFNQHLIVDGIKALPDNLRHIEFDGVFNQPLIIGGSKALPDSLHHIEFGSHFNQPLMINGIKVLPSNLQEITSFGNPLDLYYIPLSVNKISSSGHKNKNCTFILLKFKAIYNRLPLPIAEEITYYMEQKYNKN